VSDFARHNDPGRADTPDEARQNELRRENQLVRSTGRISKPVMAAAFGMVFLLIAAVVAAPLRQWLWASMLGGVGGACIAWAFYMWSRRR
jgi:hypothetical protein